MTRIYCDGNLIYDVITNHSLSLDEALDIVAPYGWREEVNELGFFLDSDVYDGCIWYDGLTME